jgi:hypothetical protein
MAKVFRIEKDTLENASHLFLGCTDLEYFSTPNNGGGWGEYGHYYPVLKYADSMFNDSYNLKIAYCSMPNLITATEMFGEAGHLRSSSNLDEIYKCFIALELGGKLTNAERMFDGAKNFREIDVEYIGNEDSSISSANYQRMFVGVKNIGSISLNIASNSLENLDMGYAFSNSYVKSLYIPSMDNTTTGNITIYNFNKIKNCSGMFMNSGV